MTGLLDAPVLEHALLPVRPGEQDAFEAAMAEAVPLVSSIPGFRGIRVSRGVEQPGTYLLLIGWDSVEAHEVGFRGSPQYAAVARAPAPLLRPVPGGRALRPGSGRTYSRVTSPE